MPPERESDGNGAAPGADAVDPAALTAEQLAKMLQLPEEKVREHLAAGAPQDAGGRVNLVHYAAWLNRQLAGSDGDR
ncbi:MAG: hypothetical protein ACP5HU_12920 [Phycisphaerae bacterium]